MKHRQESNELNKFTHKHEEFIIKEGTITRLRGFTSSPCYTAASTRLHGFVA